MIYLKIKFELSSRERGREKGRRRRKGRREKQSKKGLRNFNIYNDFFK